MIAQRAPHKHMLRLKSAGRMGYTFECEACEKQRSIGKYTFWLPTLYLRWKVPAKGTALA